MRYAKQFFMVIASCQLFASTMVHAADVSEKCQTIVYSANPQYPPYHWAVDGSRLAGASIELLEKLRPDRVTLKPVVYPWKRVLLMAKRGEIDLVLSLRKTPERSAFLAFTEGRSFPNPIVVFVRDDRGFNYGQWSDLKGRRGVISLGDQFGGGFDEYWPKELDVLESGTMEENFRRLREGQVDYFITSQFAGIAHLGSPLGRDGPAIKHLLPPISDEGVYFGFSKKSPCVSLIPEFDRKLSALESQHKLVAMLKKSVYQSGTTK